MEGGFGEANELCLFNFRRRIRSDCSPLEFAKRAFSYDPYHVGVPERDTENESHEKCGTVDLINEFKCSGVSPLDVSSVFELGRRSFVTCADLRINLYKVYIYLKEAMKRLNLEKEQGVTKEHQEHLKALKYILRRFNDYIKITMRLSESFNQFNLRVKKKIGKGKQGRGHHPEKFTEITSRFKVDHKEIKRLFQTESEDSERQEETYQSREVLTLLWSFYRDANCSQMFGLLCYTLLTSNTAAYRTILENFSPCMKSHVRENWKVILSYVPISFDFNDYQFAFESILLTETGEDLLLGFVDWCTWRMFLIIKQTNSSYFLLIKFLKNLFKMLGTYEKWPGIRTKLQLLNFLKFIIKQYFIYKSYKTGIGNKGTLKSESREGGEYMTFFEYLDLEASKKLGLFCEFDVSKEPGECNCEELYKDKHKIYQHCIRCKTSNLSNKLKSFFIIISPAGEEKEEYSREENKKEICMDDDEIGKEYFSVSLEFREFYESLLRSYNSGLHDYISGISETFMKNLKRQSFEIMYSLATVLLETGFKNKVFNIFVNIVYGENSRYNFLENYFLIKSTYNLILTSLDVQKTSTRLETGNTLFKLLEYVEVEERKVNTSYSPYKKLISQLKSSPGEASEPEKSVSREDFGLEVVLNCIQCQLDFSESLLNLLSVIRSDTETVPEVTPLEITMAMVHEEYFLVLLQKVTLFIVDLCLEPQEFSNCLLELMNLRNYLSSVSCNKIHQMFFYTLASVNNLNYLNHQVQLWFNYSQLDEGDSNQNFNEKDSQFLNRSLDCVLNSVCKMDKSCNINLFTFVMTYSKFVPKDNKFYNTISSTNSLSIYSVITLYLNYVNNQNREEGGVEENPELSEVDRDNLEMLVTLSKVYKCLFLLDIYSLNTNKNQPLLEYNMYNQGELVERTLASLISLIQSKYLNPVKQPRWFESERDYQRCGKRGKILLLVFKSILEYTLSTQTYGAEFFANLKIVVVELCPEEVSQTILKIVEKLATLGDHSTLENKDSFRLEECEDSFKNLLDKLTLITSLQNNDLATVSDLVASCGDSQLSEVMSLVYENYMEIGHLIKGDTLTQEYQVDSDRGRRLDEAEEASGEEEEDDEIIQDLEIGELFNYQNEDYPEVDSFDDEDFRRSVLNLLDVNRSEKTGVKESIGKLATKLGHNVASDFITAAIEKAEGELMNIAKKTHKLDLIKDKLFYTKSEQTFKRSMFMPVLNFYEGKELHPAVPPENDHSGLNELLQYRNVNELNVWSLVSVNVEASIQLLMENCSYSCNRLFLTELHQVFNRNDVRKCASFLEYLLPYLSECDWSPEILEKLTDVKDFLFLFSDFPSNFTLLTSSFVFNKDYRFSKLSRIPSFVAANSQLVYKIYHNLELFENYSQFKNFKDSTPEEPVDCADYLFGPLSEADVQKHLDTPTFSDPLKTSSGHLLQDFSLFVSLDRITEYVDLLLTLFEEIFLENFDPATVFNLEPLFLLSHEKYLYFLLKVYHNLVYGKPVLTPSSSHSQSNVGNSSGTQFSTPRTPGGSLPPPDSRLRSSRLLIFRYLLYNLLLVYPEFRESFNFVYQSNSMDPVRFLELVFKYIPDFDLTSFENLHTFTQTLLSQLTLDNFFYIAYSIEPIDPGFGSAVYRRLELRLRPHSDELVDCTRMLFEYDLSNNTY